ncbi:DUF1853 family protein [Microbulbifer sp. SAOS-129_SWC]|uniref:DUF1853 family protein n=1 Tax=Microbulbifer sp. SAOS-129_SWC TaxID=3145235 RepID=UPI003217589F
MPVADHWENLLWALGAEDIARGGGLPWLPPQRRAALAGYFAQADTRAQLADTLDAELQRADAHGPVSRLGVYFENLWAFAFTHHPDYQLQQRNLPLRADGRTLGELDFVTTYLPDRCTEHWEIAVKFYLEVDSGYWVGPGLRDRLDIKLARMREHQLPLIRQPAARALLQQHNIRIDRQWARMPGRLFRPVDHGAMPLHAGINPHSCHYWWACADEFRFHFADRPFRWSRLPKRAWLADRGYGVDDSASATALADRLGADEQRGPLCVAAQQNGREVSRGFIVPDDWHDAALTRLPE